MKFSYADGSQPLEGYTIKRGIGIGGFGEVYFAVSEAGKEVALKRVQRHLEIELRGVSLCLNLKHRNLVDLYDIKYDDQGGAWVVMEFITGENLKEVIDRHPQGLPHEEVLRWFHGIADGVAYLHDKGLVHRDLKPGNIFNDQGTIKIGDYGLSKFIGFSQQSGQTESVGTFHYMAPEIGKGYYGKEVDIYALGVVLHEMVTGQVPFDGESSQEIIMRHLTEDPPVEDLPPRFRDVVETALQKDPALRFTSIAEMAAALPMIPAAKRVFESPVIIGTVVPDPQPSKEVLYIGDETRVPEMQFGPLRQHATSTPPVRAKVAYVKTPIAPPTTAARATRTTPRSAVPQDSSWRRFGEWLHGSWLATGLKVALVISSLLLVLSGQAWLLPIGLVGAAILLITIVASALTLGNEPSTPYTNTSGITFRSWQEMLRDQLRGKTNHERIGELLGSFLAAAFVCALVGIVMIVVADQFEPSIQSASQYTWLTLSTTLATWCVLAVGKFCEGSESDAVRRRLVMLTLGLLCGAAVFGCAELLLLDVKVGPELNAQAHTMYQSDGTPKLPLYLAFFGVVLALPRWWKQTDPLRRTRVNLLAVATCVLLGGLFQLVWPYPQPYGMMSLAMISLATQLSASWFTAKEREQARREFRRV